MKPVVRIANASGYWGDDPDALLRQVTGGLAGVRLDHDGERRHEEIRGRVVAANAYISARPELAARRGGARIVVTGRTTDAALIPAPLVHEF